MLGDVNNKVSVAQAITGTAFSTSSIDRLARQDMGAGRSIAMCFRTTQSVLPAAIGTPPAGITVTMTDTGDLVNLTAHGLRPGNMVTFISLGATTGLTIGRIYYVNTVPTANSFTVSATLNGVGGTPVALTTDSGAGAAMIALPTVEFQVVAGDVETLDADAGSGADVALADVLVLGSSGPLAYRGPRTVEVFTNGTDTITSTNHNLATGMPVVFAVQGAGVMPTNLLVATTYFAIKVDLDNFKVATSRANADAGIAVDFTTNGTLPIAWSVADGQLTLGGPMVHVEFNPQESIGRRFIGARYVVQGLLQTGAFDAQIELEASQEPKLYLSGFATP
jgi:hypothetical protein